MELVICLLLRRRGGGELVRSLFCNSKNRHLTKKLPIGTWFSVCWWNVSSNCLPEKRHSHIGYICLTFLHCAFSSVSSKRSHRRMHSHIGCIYVTFLHCAFSNVFSNGLPEKRHSRIGCICSTYWHCQSFSSGFPHPLNQSHYFDKVVPFCCVLSKWFLQTDSNQ